MHIDRLISLVEKTADPGLSAEWDQSGIQIAGTKKTIHTLAVTLDPSPAAVQEAIEHKADFILTHHPLLLVPRLPKSNDQYTAVLRQVLSSGNWLYAAHTSLDIRTSGPVAWLAKALNLNDIRPIEPIAPPKQIKFRLTGIKPEGALLQALDTAPQQPVVSCTDNHLDIVVQKEQEHPIALILQQFAPGVQVELTETAALSSPCGYGLMGGLNPALSWSRLQKQLHSVLGKRPYSSTGAPPEHIAQLAYCPGSGMSLASKAFALGADIFISGDLKFHQAQEIESLGLTLDIGHFTLEEAMMAVWADELTTALAGEIRVLFIPGRDPFQINSLTNAES